MTTHPFTAKYAGPKNRVVKQFTDYLLLVKEYKTEKDAKQDLRPSSAYLVDTTGRILSRSDVVLLLTAIL